MGKSKGTEGIWKRLMNPVVSKSDSLTANVVVFGDSNSGKKSLINAMLKQSKQLNDLSSISEGSNLIEMKKKYEHVYILDFKYLSVPKENVEGSDELGKLNFYIFNDKYTIFKQFLNEEVMKNLMIMLVLDLDRPESLTENFVSWISFINENLMSYIANLDVKVRGNLKSRFEYNIQRNRLIISPETDPTKTDFEPELTFGIPLMIVGNKSDALDSFNNIEAIETVQYTLRSLAMRYGASVIYTSPKMNSNVQTLTDYLAATMLGKNETSLTPNLSSELLFIPSSFDQDKAALDETFKETGNYVFEKKTERPKEERPDEEETVKSVQEFLADLRDHKNETSKVQPSEKMTELLAKSAIGSETSAQPAQGTQEVKRISIMKKIMNSLDKSKLPTSTNPPSTT